MRSSDPLILAFLLSSLLHAGVLVSSGWPMPESEEERATRLDARLLQFPGDVPKQVAAKQPKVSRPPKSKPAKHLESPLPDVPVAQLPPSTEQLPAPVPPPASEPLAVTEPQSDLGQMASEPAAGLHSDGQVLSTPPMGGTLGDTPPMMQSQAMADWPKQGCIRYVLNVQYGLLSGEFGQAEQCWQHDDLRYSVTLKGEAAVVWKQFRIEQESTGRIVGNVLVSDVFREKNDNRNYESLFDTVGGKVRQSRNGESRVVPTGGVALDMLTLMHFMAMQSDDVEAFDMFVVASRGTVSRVTVEQRPLKPVALPFGNTIARQFHAEARNGELKIDVWISRGLRGAPVRFRIDNKGDIVDFQAIDVTLDGKNLVHRPELTSAPLPSPSSSSE